MKPAGSLDAAELGEFLAQHRRLFRMEALPAYAVATDGDDFHRWLAGEREPTWERKTQWLDHLRAERAAGTVRTRVRVLSAELTDYERYSCEWGYAYNVEAGEDIRVLRAGEHDLPISLVADDFWVVDDREALVMRYDESGEFSHAAVVTDERATATFVKAMRTAWDAAEPFGQWWGRHPELRRGVTV